MNQKSSKCLDVADYEGQGDVGIYHCEHKDDQFWTLYESGEIVNKKSGWCLDIANYDGHGYIGTHPCD